MVLGGFRSFLLLVTTCCCFVLLALPGAVIKETQKRTYDQNFFPRSLFNVPIKANNLFFHIA